MMEFQEFIRPELLILIPVLYLIGVMIKKSEMQDKYIPIWLGVTSIMLCVLYLVATEDIINSKDIATAIFTAITQGILIAGASVYANEIVKQVGKDE